LSRFINVVFTRIKKEFNNSMGITRQFVTLPVCTRGGFGKWLLTRLLTNPQSSPKLQIPSSKLQRNSKHQASNHRQNTRQPTASRRYSRQNYLRYNFAGGAGSGVQCANFLRGNPTTKSKPQEKIKTKVSGQPAIAGLISEAMIWALKKLPALAVAIGGAFLSLLPAGHAQETMPLESGWQIQSAQAADSPGETISARTFSTAGWQPAAVPATVLGTLVNNGVYTNIYFGTNLAKISKAPFAGPWWFRKEISVSSGQAAGSAEFVFDGINYRANLWLNGKCLATTNDIFGAFRVFHIDAGGQLKAGANVLAVEIFPPQPGDFTMGFVDWNPQPPDRGMGLFRPVKLHCYQSVALDNIYVESKIDHAGWQKAALTVHADLHNRSDREIETTVHGEIGEVSFNESYTLKPGEERTIALTPEKNPQLNFEHAQLWWPWELGQPHLYDLKLSTSVTGRISDRAATSFGIREVSDYVTAEGYRGYAINGKKILIRGGGWADELLLRENEQNLEAQLQYTRAMNLNTIRLEGFWGSSQRLYDLADQYGLFVMAGFSCQWEWDGQLGKPCDNYGGFKSEADLTLATNYLHDQVLWLRNHPSIYVWVLGSDKLPRPELETRYDSLLAVIDPTRPVLKTCGDDTSKVSGPSGVKMNGPYDYVTPNYWYIDQKNGGAFGFNTETGPGPQPPPFESLQRMLPAEDLWPVDKAWNFHCARGQFGQMKFYLNAFTNRYGTMTSAEEFAFKSQAANYEAMRPMYEAFAVNLPRTTGIVQWMLNPSWPKLYWQLYDYYLVPGGAFFGARRGAAPLAIIYNYGDHGIYLVNQFSSNPGELRTALTVYDSNSTQILSTNISVECPGYGARKICDLSDLSPATPVYFVDLVTEDRSGAVCAQNFYWLSTKPDVLNEAKTTWYVTPNTSFADFSPLNHLPVAAVDAHVNIEQPAGPQPQAVVTLNNSSDRLAFFMEMRIVDPQTQQSLTPVFWDDNYVSLPPHTRRTYRALLPAFSVKPELKLQGWNVKFRQ
jgi:exo-1,4-beta-D-glucosaminidase